MARIASQGWSQLCSGLLRPHGTDSEDCYEHCVCFRKAGVEVQLEVDEDFQDRSRRPCDPFTHLLDKTLFALPAFLLGSCVFSPITKSVIFTLVQGKCKFDAAFHKDQHPHALPPC